MFQPCSEYIGKVLCPHPGILAVNIPQGNPNYNPFVTRGQKIESANNSFLNLFT